MDINMVDITLQFKEETSSVEREELRNDLLSEDGVISADYHAQVPYLFVVTYNPCKVHSQTLLDIMEKQPLNTQFSIFPKLYLT